MTNHAPKAANASKISAKMMVTSIRALLNKDATAVFEERQPPTPRWGTDGGTIRSARTIPTVRQASV
jgi:hypothetical protein